MLNLDNALMIFNTKVNNFHSLNVPLPYLQCWNHLSDGNLWVVFSLRLKSYWSKTNTSDYMCQCFFDV